MVNHPETGVLLFGFTEIFQKNLSEPGVIMPTEEVWQRRSDILSLETEAWKRQITDIEFCQSDPDVVFVVTGGQQNPPGSDWQLHSKIYKSTKGLYENSSSNYFSDVRYPGEDYDDDTLAIVSGIAVDPADPDKVFICYAGLIGEFRVWYSDNGGDDWINLDPNGVLKNKPVNAIAYQENTNDRLYIGTDFGLYTKDKNSDWIKVEEFPSVRITELKINKTFNKLRVATFGRGLWEGQLAGGSSQSPQAPGSMD
jgi:hypothetical protein